MVISGTIWFLISFLSFSLNLSLKLAVTNVDSPILIAISLIAAIVGAAFYLHPIFSKKK